LFLLTLPLTFFLAALPSAGISGAISNAVLALALNLGIFSVATVLNALLSMALGVGFCMACVWSWDKLQLGKYIQPAQFQRPVEASPRINRGAIGGLAVGMVVFIITGAVPIHSVAVRVEHLFPAPLIISMGEIARVDLSAVYGTATGFISVGFLFAIFGIAGGSILVAIFELLMRRVRK